jgi:hypothetical protein
VSAELVGVYACQGLRAVRGSAVVNRRTRKTCGGHVVNGSKNSRVSLYVLG